MQEKCGLSCSVVFVFDLLSTQEFCVCVVCGSQVVLVVNVASACGFTKSNYEQLTELQNRFGLDKFVVSLFASFYFFVYISSSRLFTTRNDEKQNFCADIGVSVQSIRCTGAWHSRGNQRLCQTLQCYISNLCKGCCCCCFFFSFIIFFGALKFDFELCVFFSFFLAFSLEKLKFRLMSTAINNIL